MKRLAAVLTLALLIPCARAQAPLVVVADVTGVIGPATAETVQRALARAQAQHAALVVLRMDTPGGLDTSMRRIIKGILASPVPVATYVAPSGARAASAGTYILYASPIAAMAPGTNVGAATPVMLGAEGEEKKTPDAMTRKRVNDAVAYLQSLAQLRGRNIQFAERAVREAASLTADEARKEKVIDLRAATLDELLTKLDGRTVTLGGASVVLHTRGARVETIEPNWRSRLLVVITDPNVAYILMLLGVYGLFFELWNPGYVLPGVTGAISLLLALYAFQVLPVNYAGVGLVLLGLAFMTAEAFMPSYGALGVGGVIAFVVGSIILMDTEVPGFGVSLWLIATLALLSLGFMLTVVSVALKARRRPVVAGREDMLGEVAVAIVDVAPAGRVRVRGEDWAARSNRPIRAGEAARIVGLDGLTLIVEPNTKSQ